MALKKEHIENGTVYPNAYFKINGFNLHEDKEVDNVKQYYAQVEVEMFTDTTKNYSLGMVQLNMPRQDFGENDITLASMYTWLKGLPCFEGATNV